jgi:hypothetical protein
LPEDLVKERYSCHYTLYARQSGPIASGQDLLRFSPKAWLLIVLRLQQSRHSRSLGCPLRATRRFGACTSAGASAPPIHVLGRLRPCRDERSLKAVYEPSIITSEMSNGGRRTVTLMMPLPSFPKAVSPVAKRYAGRVWPWTEHSCGPCTILTIFPGCSTKSGFELSRSFRIFVLNAFRRRH